MRGVRLRRQVSDRAAKAVLSILFIACASSVSVAQMPNPQAASATPTAQEMISDVRIVGNESIPVAKIKPHIRTRPDRPFDIELVEQDVRKLNDTRMFVHVRPLYDRTPNGVVVIFEVRERPTVQYIRYVGNDRIKDKGLGKKVELKVGDSLDPFSIDEARRRLEDFYHEKGFRKARVEVQEGGQLTDKGAVFKINEGPRQRVRWVSFEGNYIASDSRLKTQIKSKPPIAYIVKGYYDEEQIASDVDRLTKYYRSLGFFQAKVGREVEFNENGEWANVTFVIDEGLRYKVRNVSFIGNEVLGEDFLRTDMEVASGEFFDQALLNNDISRIQDEYGIRGYIYADTNADTRFLEEPGTLDIVYVIEEGERFRIGDVNVHIGGDNPHTRITTIMNRLSVRPGDIASTRELQDSERRIKAAQIFNTNPQQGGLPKVSFGTPNFDGTETGIANRSAPSPRGQSPDPPQSHATNRPAPEEQPKRINAGQSTDSTRGPVVRGQSPGTGRLMPSPAPLVPNMSTNTGTYPPAANYNTPQQQYTTQQPAVPQQQYAPQQQYPQQQYAQPQYSAPQNTGPPSAPPPVVTYPPANTSVQTAPPANVAPWNAGQPPANLPQQVGPPQGGNTGFGAPPQVTYPPAYPGPGGGGLPPPYFQRDAAPQVQTLPRGGATTEDEIFPPGGYNYLDPTVDIDAYAEETQTGRLMFGVGINSDAGLVGNIVLDEQNFDLFRPPTSWEDVRNGSAFRGRGQQFRIEAVPGTELQRYMFNFREPYLFDTQVQFGVSAYLFDRRFLSWDEQRLGGRLTLGYQFAPDLSGSVFVRGERVNISDVAVPTPAELAAAEGDSDLFVGGVTLAHNTRDNNFLPTEGHLIELTLEQAFGTYEFPRAGVDARQHFLVRQRPDGSGRHVLSFSGRLGFTGSDTPIYENYFAGGFSTIRGFDFRGASPNELGVYVGGEFLMLGSVEYLFPITANDMLRGVVFCDTGTVEESIELNSENYRVAPGFGLRISVPALGPAPIALDLAFPVAHADTDDLRNFSFFVGFGR